MKNRFLTIVALAGLLCGPAFAQSTYPTVASGNPRVAGVVVLQCDATGANCGPATLANPGLVGIVYSGVQARVSVPATDGQGAQLEALNINAYNRLYNGTGWDRARGDTTGQYVVHMPSAIAAAGVVTVSSAAVSGGLVIKASAGNLFSYNVVAGASAGYVMVFNSTTVPADGAVTPVRCIPLAANTGIEVQQSAQPTYYNAGITIVFSTTGCFLKTISATAFIAGDAK